MRRKPIRRSRNRWTVQFVPLGSGHVKTFNMYLYPAILGTLAIVAILGISLSAAYFSWQKTQELDEQVAYLQQVELDNEQLQQEMSEMAVFFQEEMQVLHHEVDHLLDDMSGLNDALVQLYELDKHIQMLDEGLQGIPFADSIPQKDAILLLQHMLPDTGKLGKAMTASYALQPNTGSAAGADGADGAGGHAQSETTDLQRSPMSDAFAEDENVVHMNQLLSSIQTLRAYTELLLTASTTEESELNQLISTLEHYEKKGQFIPSISPTEGRITSHFGWRRDPFHGARRKHEGIDFGAPYGTPIHATAQGTVTYAGRNGGFGNHIEINHGNGYRTTYSHLSSILIKPGTTVQKGDLIGRMGSTGRSTGVHLHYEVHRHHVPVDPLPYIQGGT